MNHREKKPELRLILVRHGNTFEEGQLPLQIGAKTDLPLTLYGHLQAEMMGKYILREKIVPQAIYSGHLKRQTQSAAAIGRLLSMPVAQTAALNEIDYGLWENLSSEEIARRWPKEYVEWTQDAKWQNKIFGGSEITHRAQLLDWFQSLSARFLGTIIAVTSNGLLRLLKNQKVKTGHFCEIILQEKIHHIVAWDQSPKNPSE